MTELHALRQALLTEARNHADQLDASLLGSIPLSGPLFEVSTHLTDDDDRLGLRIVFKHFKVAHIVGARVGIATDTNGRRDAIGKL